MPAPTAPADPLQTPTPDSAPSSSSESPTPVDPPAPEPTSTVEPTLLQRAQALVKPKATIQAESADFKKQLTASLAANDLLAAQVAELTASTELLKTELEEVGKVVSTLEGQAKSATQVATDMVAATGIPAVELPAQEIEPTETLATLEAALNATTDPREKGVIAAKIRKIR